MDLQYIKQNTAVKFWTFPAVASLLHVNHSMQTQMYLNLHLDAPVPKVRGYNFLFWFLPVKRSSFLYFLPSSLPTNTVANLPKLQLSVVCEGQGEKVRGPRHGAWVGVENKTDSRLHSDFDLDGVVFP